MRQRVIIAMALALNPGCVDPRRADNRARCRRAARDPAAGAGSATRARVRRAVHHARPLLALRVRDRIAIMYAGEIIEQAPAAVLRTAAEHPYTLGLISSFPSLTGPLVRMTGIAGSPPDLATPPAGCRFHPRCPHCSDEQSALHTLQTTVRPRLTRSRMVMRSPAIWLSSERDCFDRRTTRGSRADEALPCGDRADRTRQPRARG